MTKDFNKYFFKNVMDRTKRNKLIAREGLILLGNVSLGLLIVGLNILYNTLYIRNYVNTPEENSLGFQIISYAQYGLVNQIGFIVLCGGYPFYLILRFVYRIVKRWERKPMESVLKNKTNITKMKLEFVRRFLAFIIDTVFIVIIDLIVFTLLLEIFKPSGINFDDFTDQGKDLLFLFNTLRQLFIAYLYFWLIPKKVGNTFGRRILNIHEKYSFLEILRRLLSPTKHTTIKVDRVLRVVVMNGMWVCPSCKEKNLEIYDVCGNCEQEIIKNS